MKANFVVLIGFVLLAFPGVGQISKPGIWDKGCPSKSLFANEVNISSNDFIEVHDFPSYGNGPVYIVRVYADGRLEWHGEGKVTSIGERSSSLEVAQARALIANTRDLGFGELCDEYAMRAFDSSVYTVTLSIGGLVKVVRNFGSSNAPTWLNKLDYQIQSLEPVQRLIGPKQDQHQH